MLCPVQCGAEGTLPGKHFLIQPILTQEVQLMHTSLSSNVRGMHNEMAMTMYMSHIIFPLNKNAELF